MLHLYTVEVWVTKSVSSLFWLVNIVGLSSLILCTIVEHGVLVQRTSVSSIALLTVRSVYSGIL